MIIKEGERIDELQRNGYRIIQKTNGFCFGMDAVLLSGFASVKPGEKALDLGTGTGIIPILLEAKTEGSHFTGLEIQAAIRAQLKKYIQRGKCRENCQRDILTTAASTGSEHIDGTNRNANQPINEWDVFVFHCLALLQPHPNKVQHYCYYK